MKYDNRNTVFFSISSYNFLAYSITLWKSLLAFHPDSKFYLLICDTKNNTITLDLPFSTFGIEELEISKLDEMIAKYNITELNTALKPFGFLHLFDLHPGSNVVYLDPDIVLFSPLTELMELHEQGYDCVLTPHICEPSEFAEINEADFLRFGVFNFGFCSFRESEHIRRIIAWWGRRLISDCRISFSEGLFVDQKWGDLFPAFIENLFILRHPGYNVSYWNLSQRTLSYFKNNWYINDQPLRFFHFSGNKIENPDIFSRHSSQFNIYNVPYLSRLLSHYRKHIFESGHKDFIKLTYSFNWNGIHSENSHSPIQDRSSFEISAGPYVPIISFQNKANFDNWRCFYSDVIKKRSSHELFCSTSETYTSISGYCHVCGKDQVFLTSLQYSTSYDPEGIPVPNWREHLSCIECGTICRLRALICLLDFLDFDPNANVYVTEFITPFFQVLKKRFEFITGSEYFVNELDFPGTLYQDVQQLTFKNDSFDLIICLEVLEHVADYKKALSEFYRCLKASGTLILTFPFSYDHADDVVRADVDRFGNIVHLLEPEYHGNPLSQSDTSLCFRYFGWSIVDILVDAGFSEVKVYNVWSYRCAILGDIFIVVATK